jgi:hypothetical protein
VQRWTFKRLVVALATAAVIFLLALNWARLFGTEENTHTPVDVAAMCDGELEPLWLQAQAVATAEFVPCVRALPVGWSFGWLTVNNGISTISVDHDRAGTEAIDVTFTESCDVSGSTEVAADVPGARRFEADPDEGTDTVLTWYEVYAGGCTTVRLSSDNDSPEVLDDLTGQADRVVGFVSREDLDDALDERSDGRVRLNPPA